MPHAAYVQPAPYGSHCASCTLLGTAGAHRYPTNHAHRDAACSRAACNVRRSVCTIVQRASRRFAGKSALTRSATAVRHSCGQPQRPCGDVTPRAVATCRDGRAACRATCRNGCAACRATCRSGCAACRATLPAGEHVARAAPVGLFVCVFVCACLFVRACARSLRPSASAPAGVIPAVFPFCAAHVARCIVNVVRQCRIGRRGICIATL